MSEQIIKTLAFAASPTNEMDTHITITEGKFKDVTFKFGRVWFEDPESPVLSFDYDIVASPDTTVVEFKDEFLNLIGDVLLSLIRKAIDEETTVFTGGAKVEEGTVEEIIESPTLFEPPPVDSKILTPWSYKLPEPEPGTKMSRNLLENL